jgi:type IV secretory pathway VirB10-like protein
VSANSIPPELARSPVFDRERLMRSRVTHPSSGWALALGVAFILLLGLMSFAALYESRQHPAKTLAAQNSIGRPPPRVLSFHNPPRAVTAILASASPPKAPVDSLSRLRAPAVVVDLSEPSAPMPAAAAQAAAANGGDDKLSPDERFALRMHSNSVETSHATKLRNPSELAPQGTVIPAVLETAIDSDLPGSVRAVVSRDVRGFDGTRVLVPRGSKLIGEYRSGISLGHSRAFVIWSRILTPDGVSIDVGSPGTDPLGRGGLSGETDSHFFTRFGGAMLLSVLSAGTELAAAQGSGTSIVIGSTVPPTQPAADALQKQVDIPVTVRVPQGTPLQVFVNRDLDFATVPTNQP